MCIEVLTRQPPYPTISTTEFAVRVIPDGLTLKITEYIPPDAPDWLAGLVRSCLQQKPENR